MSFETCRQIVTTRFQTNWNVATLPVVYENQPAPATDGAWGRFSVLQAGTNPMTIGNQGFKRGIGIGVLQVFVPENGGTKTFTDCADAFAAIFDLARVSSGATYIHFDTTGIVQASGTKGWLQRNITVQFRRDSGA